MNEETVFHLALEKLPGDRSALLDVVCEADPELRSQVERLLDEHERGESFILDTPPANLSMTIDSPIAERPGTVIGPYKLLQQIGEGGMGVVFMAEQTQPLQRTVALKIIKPGMDTRQVIGRFEAERQAVAMMDHPNIAKVLDAGTTDSGRPYFVMELVKGVAITKYCDEKHLPLRARLELFMQVCQAVQHAHQKGIIHRDIKPNNVLVAEYDNQAVPKVIDFGVAKATAQKLTERTMFTEFGQVLGTMEYMSPEQAKLNQLDIDTRSDIYSLGVLLYEMLAGSTPFERKRLHAAAFEEMLRIIREEEPPKPSTRLSTSAELHSLAASRDADPKKLSGLVRGELDWVVMKALDKDRDRRYETANAMAQDIEHCLRDEPVQACPPSAAYRFRKFVRRNKRSVATAGLVMLALVGGILATTWQAVRATQANALALRRLTQVEKRNDILGSIFLDLDPRRDEQGKPLRALLGQRLQQAAAQLDSEAPGDPLSVARLQFALGSSQTFLGDASSAIGSLTKSYHTRAGLLGQDHEETLQSMHSLAFALRLVGQHDKAVPMLERVWAKRIKKLGGDHADTLSSAFELGLAYDAAGQREKALQMVEQVQASSQKSLGLNHRLTLFAAQTLASMYSRAGRFDEALPLLQETLARERATLGAENIITLRTLNSLASTNKGAGKLDKARRLLEEAFAKSKQSLGTDHPTTRMIMDNLALAYRDHGDFALAEELFLEALTRKRHTLAADDPSITHTMASLGWTYVEQKRYAEAETILRECLAIRIRNQPDNWQSFETHRALGASLLGQKKYAEAETHLVQGYNGLKQREAAISAPNRHCLSEGLEQIVELYDVWDKPDEAARWRMELMNSRSIGQTLEIGGKHSRVGK